MLKVLVHKNAPIADNILRLTASSCMNRLESSFRWNCTSVLLIKIDVHLSFQCQYIFVHDALQHYIESGFKLEIAADDLKDQLQILRKNLSSQSRLDLELEVCQD